MRAAADRDAEARRRRIHKNRFAARRTNDDGSSQITCRGTNDDIAAMWAVIEGYARTEFDKARLEGEVCEIAGLGPVPVSFVRELIDSGDPFLAAVVTVGVDVLNVVHPGSQAHRPSTERPRKALWRMQRGRL